MNRRILVFTGDGKGKTTAALGMALRAAGHGHRVCIIQFIKAEDTGELTVLRQFDTIEISQMGKGFVPGASSSAFESHSHAAEEGLILAREVLVSGAYDLVVLDEINVAVQKKLVGEDHVLGILSNAAPNTNIVLTGRNATPRIIDMADTVTEMTLIKHAMSAGTPAQPGVEF